MEEEKVKKVKSNKGLIFFLLFIIFLLVGYIAYDKLVLDNNYCNVTLQEDDNNETTKELSVDSKEVKDLLDLFDSIYINHDSLYGYGKYLVNNISEFDLVVTSIINDKSINYCVNDYDNLKSTNLKSLNENISDLFDKKEITMDDIVGNGKISSDENIDYYFNDYGLIINDENITITGPCSTNNFKDYIDKKVIKAEMIDDYIYIYEKQAFAKYNDEVYTFYNNYKFEGKSKQSFGLTEENNLDWDLYNTYKYTFKKINDKYYFYGFEIVIE